jgi:hypothetical protein
MSPATYKEEVTIRGPASPLPTARPAVPVPIYGRSLFADSLLESKRGLNRRRGWATILSLAIQGVLLCIAVLVPLIYTDVLPKQQLLTLLVAPPPPPPPPPPAAPEVVKRVRSI